MAQEWKQVFEDFKRKLTSKQFTGADVQLLTKSVKALYETDQEIRDLVEATEDVSLVLRVPGIASGYIKIASGKLEVGEGEISEPDLVLEIPEETAIKILRGELDATTAYMSGEIMIEGDMTRVLALRSLLELVGNRLGIQLV